MAIDLERWSEVDELSDDELCELAIEQGIDPETLGNIVRVRAWEYDLEL